MYFTIHACNHSRYYYRRKLLSHHSMHACILQYRTELIIIKKSKNFTETEKKSIISTWTFYYAIIIKLKNLCVNTVPLMKVTYYHLPPDDVQEHLLPCCNHCYCHWSLNQDQSFETHQHLQLQHL